MKRIKYFLFALVILVAFFLRFYKLNVDSPSLTWDEAAWGYNAYTLGIDGKDEFGKFLPITYLESFGDFKPPVYAYLSILPIKIFGLTEFATRFASAFFGVLTVLLTYFLVKEIFYAKLKSQNSKVKTDDQNSENRKFKIENSKLEILALLTAGLLAISPWHILLSRAAFEANIASFFLILGVNLFLLSTNHSKKGWLLPLSIISFVLSMYTFNTARIVVPFLVLCLFVAKRKILIKMKKLLLISIMIGLILFLPLAVFLTTPQAKLRFQEVNIFSDQRVVLTANQQIGNDDFAFWSKIIHNRRLIFASEYLRHYFDNLNPLFLFVKGDGNPKFSIQDVGQMYLWEFPFFIAGILYLIRKKESNWWIIPTWILIGIVPAATAYETPHALRIETTLPMFQLLTAYGIYNLISNLNFNKPFILLISGFALFNFVYFYHSYFNHYPREFSGEWQYGYKEAINYASTVEKDYDKIFFTQELGRPYIYVLFHKKYDPAYFRKEAFIEREVFGFVHVNEFGKYFFEEKLKDKYRDKKILYIDVLKNVPESANVIKKFNLLNGEVSFIAYTK